MICHESLKLLNYISKSIVFVFCYIMLFLSLSACYTIHHAYSTNMFYGEKALRSGYYDEAKQNFEEAYEKNKTPEALMYLAMVDYKTNNLDSAESLVREAEWMGSVNYHYLRVLGYKALILLKKNSDEGLEALDQYVGFYASCDPLMSIQEVRRMAQTSNIDMPLLEKLIEEQVSWFENDVELYWSSGVGYYDARSFFGGSFRFHGGGIFH